MSAVHDIIILGSGPAGYTAALYAARAGLSPVLFSGLQPGGQLTITTEVENYPGFPDGIQGPEVMEKFRAQAARFGTVIHDTLIERVDFSQRPFRMWTDGGEEFAARAVIVATGASAMLLGLPSEQQYMGFGVSACATCDGFFYKNKRVLVVGGGDTAMEEANYLTRMCSEVIVVHRRSELRASKIMQERARANAKIRFLLDTVVAEVVGDGKQMSGARLKNVVTGEITEMKVDGLFVAIGHQPNTAFLGGQLATDGKGYVQVKPGTSYTSVEGVFAAGDVQDSVYRQAVTAAGSGCMAAIDAERWLESQAHAESAAAGAKA